jgi:hypothetical protein
MGNQGHFTSMIICPKISRMTFFFGTEGVGFLSIKEIEKSRERVTRHRLVSFLFPHSAGPRHATTTPLPPPPARAPPPPLPIPLPPPIITVPFPNPRRPLCRPQAPPFPTSASAPIAAGSNPTPSPQAPAGYFDLWTIQKRPLLISFTGKKVHRRPVLILPISVYY